MAKVRAVKGAAAMAGVMFLAACADVRRAPRPEVKVTLKWHLGSVGVDPGVPVRTVPPSDACVQFGFGCP